MLAGPLKPPPPCRVASPRGEAVTGYCLGGNFISYANPKTVSSLDARVSPELDIYHRAPGHILTPLKFQVLGEGNTGVWFCRCRLGLEKEKDTAFVNHVR
jgi:hypothetical protein